MITIWEKPFELIKFDSSRFTGFIYSWDNAIIAALTGIDYYLCDLCV